METQTLVDIARQNLQAGSAATALNLAFHRIGKNPGVSVNPT
jgi:hypothetical protein